MTNQINTIAHDLGCGFWAKFDDGELSIRNFDKGLRITLTVDETNRLRELLKTVELVESPTE